MAALLSWRESERGESNCELSLLLSGKIAEIKLKLITTIQQLTSKNIVW